MGKKDKDNKKDKKQKKHIEEDDEEMIEESQDEEEEQQEEQSEEEEKVVKSKKKTTTKSKTDKNNKKDKKQKKQQHSDDDEEMIDESQDEEEGSEEESSKLKSKKKSTSKLTSRDISLLNNPYRNKNYQGKRFDEFMISEYKVQIPIPDDIPTTYSKISAAASQSQFSHAPTTITDYDKMYLIFQSMENNYKEIASYATKRLNDRKQVFEYVQVVMQSITAEDEKSESSKHRGNLIEVFLTEFIQFSNSFDERDLNKCMDLLLSECDGLSRHAYREIASVIVGCLSTNRKSPTLLLLPKVMEQLSFISTSTSDIEANDSYKNHIFKTIIESEWNPTITISILSTLNDMTFNSKQLEQLIEKIFTDAYKLYCQGSSKTSHNEYIDQLPHIIHNVILLTRQGNKGKILSSVCDFFATLEREDHYGGEPELNPLVCVESLILQQVCLSIQQDPDLGKEYFRMNQRPSQFVIGLLMVVSKIPRFKNTIFEVLKQLANICSRTGQNGLEVFNKTARNKWEQTTESFVNFSIMLMESNALIITEQIKYQRAQGQDILLEIYGKNKYIRHKIIDEIVARIIMKSDSLFSNWFSLLGSITALDDDPIVLSKLKEVFNYLQHYSTGTVTQLIQAFKPILLRDNGSFLNVIVIILKKAMFAREVESRSCAVTGFIELLKAVATKRMSVNQRELDKIKSFNNEVFGILRRALSQQNAIRTILYQGFIELINYDFSDYIYELLNTQALTYFELTGTGDSNSPLELELCIEYKQLEAVIVEPIDKLIYCIQYCLINGKGSLNWEKNNKNSRNKSTRTAGQTQSNIINNNNNDNNSTMVEPIEQSKIRETLQKNFQKMISLMNECNLGSFGLQDVPDGRDKSFMVSNVKCLLMIGVVESLIEHESLSTLDPSLERILSLFDLFSQLKKLQGENQLQMQKLKLKKKKSSDDDNDNCDGDNDQSDDDGGKASKSKRGRKGTTKSGKSSKSTTNSSSSNAITSASSTKLLSIEFPSKDCFITVMKLIYKNGGDEFDREESGTFILYIYQILSNLLSKLVSTFKMYRKNVDMNTIESKKAVEISFFKSILPYVYTEIHDKDWIRQLPKPNGKKSEASIHSTAIHCFNLICTFIQENGNETTMCLTLQDLCDELKFKQDVKQYIEDRDLYKQQQEQLQQQDQEEDYDEEDDEKPKPPSKLIEKPIRPVKGQNLVRGRKIIQNVAKSIEMIIISHLFPEYNADIEMLLNSLVILYSYLDSIDEVAISFKFLKSISSNHAIESPSIASIVLKAIVDMCNVGGSQITGNLAMYVLTLLGSFDPNSAGDANGNGRKDGAGKDLSSKVLAIINHKTVASAINILLDNQDSNIERNNNDIKGFKKDWKSSRSTVTPAQTRDLVRFRDSIATSSNNCCQVLNHLSISKITGPPRTRFLDTIRKLYSQLTKFIELLTSTECQVNTMIEDLIEQSSVLCSHIVDFVEWIDNEQVTDTDSLGNGKQLTRPDKLRLIKETKILPEIIGNVEKYQSSITKYEKKLGIPNNKPYGKHLKKFKSREFTIASTVLQRDNSDDENDGDGDGKKKKRRPAVKKSPTTSKKPSSDTSRKRKPKDDDGDGDDSPTKKVKRSSVNISKSTRKSATKGKK